MGILEREYDRLSERISSHQKAIGEAPRGALSEKVYGGRRYVYVAHRERRRVRFEYVGLADHPRVRRLRERIDQRRVHEALLRAARRAQREIERALMRLAPRIRPNHDAAALMDRNFRHAAFIREMRELNGRP